MSERRLKDCERAVSLFVDGGSGAGDAAPGETFGIEEVMASRTLASETPPRFCTRMFVQNDRWSTLCALCGDITKMRSWLFSCIATRTPSRHNRARQPLSISATLLSPFI